MVSSDSEQIVNIPRSAVQKVDPHIQLEWLADSRIVVYTITDFRRETIDAGYDVMSETMRTWPADRPYLALNYLKVAHSSISPYMAKRLREIRAFRPDLKGYIAIVMGRGLITHLLRAWVRTNPAYARKNEIFTSRERAVDWLRSKMDKLPDW